MKNKIGVNYLKLGEIAETITKGTTPTTNGFPFVNEGINFYKVENIFNGIINKKSNLNFISEEANNSLERSKLRVNDILFSIAGTIGNVAKVHEEDLPANVNQALAIIRGYESHVLTEYLLIVLNSEVVRTTIRKARGVALYNISLEDLKEMVIPIPPFEEQKKISSIIKKADSIRKKRQQQINLADEFLRATFLEMFGDPKKNPNRFKLNSIGSLIDEIENENPLLYPTKLYSYIDISSIDNLNKKIIKTIKFLGCEAPSRARQLAEKGDIIASTVRPNLNSVAIIDIDYTNLIVSTGFCVLRCKNSDLDNYYLFALLTSEFFVSEMSKIAKGASYPAISNSDILDFEIPIPPENLRKNFKDIFVSVKRIKDKLLPSLTESYSLFNSLMQKAFRGEL